MTTKVLASAAALLFASMLSAQKISNPSASVLDVPARQAFLKTTTDARLHNAMAHLGSCTASPLVPAPIGEMQIPHHYMHGSNGPTNPAEAEATRTYGAFEHRITAGMNQWVATGNQAEAQCALAQLDAWAQAKALTNYDPKAYSQSWFQAEWSLASAGVTASVLKQDTALDPAQQERVAKWLRNAANQLISYEKPGELGNNHHYWRALAATSIGVLSNDNELFRFGVNTFKQAVGQEDNERRLSARDGAPRKRHPLPGLRSAAAHHDRRVRRASEHRPLRLHRARPHHPQRRHVSRSSHRRSYRHQAVHQRRAEDEL